MTALAPRDQSDLASFPAVGVLRPRCAVDMGRRGGGGVVDVGPRGGGGVTGSAASADAGRSERRPGSRPVALARRQAVP